VTGGSIGSGSKRRSKLRRRAGYSRVRARSEPGEVFIARSFTSNIARASCLQEPWHGCQGGGRRAPGLRPVADGSAPARVCAAAACHRPRGRRHVTPVGAQCSRRFAMDWRSLACSGVRARWYGGADVASRA
jgi:hypothetical protein